jgi:hypothetical protein
MVMEMKKDLAEVGILHEIHHGRMATRHKDASIAV